MAMTLAQAKIDQEFMGETDLGDIKEDDLKGDEMIAGVVNGFFNDFEVPGKQHTIMAGVDDKDDTPTVYIAIVDKEKVEDVADEDDYDYVNQKQTLVDNADAVISLKVKESWEEEHEVQEYDLPARHSAQLEPEQGQTLVTINHLSISLSDAEVVVEPPNQLESAVNAIKDIDDKFYIGSSSVDDRDVAVDFELDSDLSKDIGQSFGKAAYGVSNSQEQTKEMEKESESLAMAV